MRLETPPPPPDPGQGPSVPPEIPAAPAGEGPLTARPATPRLKFLDGLRGLAAFYVVVHHAYYGLLWEHRMTSAVRFGLVPLFFGHLAVGVFIVLSGYVLMLPVSLAGRGKLPKGTADYLRRRARRILPPYFAALALSLAFMGIWIWVLKLPTIGFYWEFARPNAFTPGSLISHVLLFHNFTPLWASSIDPVFWSIATEWQIYFLLPWVLLPVWRRLGSVAAIVAGFVIGFGVMMIFPSLGAGCPWYVGLFAMGMIAADIGYGRGAQSRWATKTPWGWLSLLAFVVMVGIIAFIPREWWKANWWAIDPFAGASAMCLIIYANQQTLQPGWIVRLLQSRVAVGLGAFSYSLYLIHVPILAIGHQALRNAGLGPNLEAACMFLIFVPTCVLLAFLFYIPFERPFTRPPARKRVEGAA